MKPGDSVCYPQSKQWGFRPNKPRRVCDSIFNTALHYGDASLLQEQCVGFSRLPFMQQPVQSVICQVRVVIEEQINEAR